MVSAAVLQPTVAAQTTLEVSRPTVRRHVPTWSPNDVSDDYFLGDTDTECCPSPDYYFFLIFFLPQDVFALNCSVHAQTSQLGCQQKILTSTERFLCSVILTKQKPTRKP